MLTLFTVVAALILQRLAPIPDTLLQSLARVLVWRPLRSAQLQTALWWFVILCFALSLQFTLMILGSLHSFFAWLAGFVVLYSQLGFIWHGRCFSQVHLALATGQGTDARRLLTHWSGSGEQPGNATEVVRLAIERLIVRAHREGFGVIFWYAVAGPVAALIYRLAGALANPDLGERRGTFAVRAFDVLDWLPVRVTAALFAVNGNFEDSVTCWRTQARRWPDRGSGILLASGGGALGLRLGLPLHAVDSVIERPEMGTGNKPDSASMQRVVGFILRVLAWWLAVLGLCDLAI